MKAGITIRFFGRIRTSRVLMCLLTAQWVGWLAPGHAEEKLSPYTYTDTRQLVSLVEDAADMVEQKGEEAFATLRVKGSRWNNNNYYFFIYNLEGVCVFHAVEPGLVGQNLITLKDMNGKPVIHYITEIAKRPEPKAAGWVFYLWEDKTQLTPMWKSAYIRKAVGPDGKIYAVGSGSYNTKIEKAFVHERVNMACELLKTKGRESAFSDLHNPAMPFHFLDTFVFVLDRKGCTLVDPSFPTHAGRDLSQMQDAVGMYVIKEILAKLEKGEEAYVQYLWPKPGTNLPSRKVAYVRKVVLEGETLVVGADFFLATPIWMKL